MSIRIALVGNPNCGKTTMFNELTGSSQYVGNWPGVTVEKKGGKLKGHKDVEIIDLPGIYSLSPYTLEEVVSRNYLMDETPDVLINIVDSTNIERNLYLTTQLIELGIPVVIALNMTDLMKKRGDKLNVSKLSEALGCPIIKTAALKGEGCQEVAKKAIELATSTKQPKHMQYASDVELVLQEIQTQLVNVANVEQARFASIKVFEQDQSMFEKLNISDANKQMFIKLIAPLEEAHDDDTESIMTNERYAVISSLLSGILIKANQSNETVSDKIDRIVTNRFLALPIFAAVMYLVYYVSVSTVGDYVTGWTNDVLFGEIIPPAVEQFLVSVNTADWLQSLILDGIIGGVGAVLGFVPQMLVLFFFLSLLEDCGYMARVAFIMDRIFRKFGLSGKSFIPMLIGTGCSVPGIMASRTIENERDRKMTIITTSFIPCGAKLPIIALIAGALFSQAAWVGPVAYFVGMAAVIVSGIILKKMNGFKGEPAPFVMELPAYHMPSLKGVLIHMWERGKSFIMKAGTVIFLSCGIIWFLSSFNTSFEMVDTKDSMLANVGKLIAPIFAPLGFGNWESAVAAITGLIAKENVVGTFGVLFGMSEVAEDGMEIWPMLATIFTQVSALSFLIFNLLCAPCFAAVGAIRREMGNAKWTWIAVGYQTGFAYAIAFMTYQFGTVLTGGGFSVMTGLAVVVLVGLLYFLFRPYKDEASVKSSNKLKVTKASV